MASDNSTVMTQGTSAIDPYQALGFVPNPDGSVTRTRIFPFFHATSDHDQSCPVLIKDVTLNETNGTWVRIYLPQEALDSSPPCKRPLIVYYHGGGFVVCSAGSTMFHEFLTILAIQTKSMIVSVDYRLAPEHRLPAAFDDCFEALHWIKTTKDEWLTKYTDTSNCFLMGISAGGNIAYQVGLRMLSEVHDLKPLEIKGMILQQPFFGQVERTNTELKSDGGVMTVDMCDLMWELCLPTGADRDHEYCNPTTGDKSSLWDGIKQLGWKVMVTGCDGDLLIEHQVKLAQAMKERGVDVVSRFVEGFYHGYELNDLSKADELCAVIKDFISSSSKSSISLL